MKIKDLKENYIKKDLFLLVKKVSQRETSSNKPFINFIFTDGIDSIDGKMWDKKIDELNIKNGDIVKVRVDVNKWQDSLQLVVRQIRQTVESDKSEFNEEDFFKTAPIEAKEMFDYILDTANNFKSETLKLITTVILEKHKDLLLYFPGAKSIHHAEKAGLLYHMYRMLLTAIKMHDVYSFNLDLLEAGVILHDIGKIYELDSDENGIVSDYTIDGNLLGHIIMGSREIFDIFKEIKASGKVLNNEETRLLLHMMISHHGEIEYGAIKKPMFLEAQLLNSLDFIDSRIFMFEEYNSKLEPGTLSDKEFSLQRKIYKPNL